MIELNPFIIFLGTTLSITLFALFLDLIVSKDLHSLLNHGNKDCDCKWVLTITPVLNVIALFLILGYNINSFFKTGCFFKHIQAKNLKWTGTKYHHYEISCVKCKTVLNSDKKERI